MRPRSKENLEASHGQWFEFEPNDAVTFSKAEFVRLIHVLEGTAPNLDGAIKSITAEIDAGLSDFQWTFIIGSYITVVSIQQNKLEADVCEGTDISLRELFALEEGKLDLDATKLCQLLRNLGRDDLDGFLREAYQAIHAELPYR